MNRSISALTLLALVTFVGSLLSAQATFAGGTRGLPMKAPDAPFTSQAAELSVAQFKGRKVMLWLFSTWCPSCATALQALAKEQPSLQQSGLQILAIQNFRNGGFPGPTMDQFLARFGGQSLIRAPNWTFGQASEQMAAAYNPRNYPDIYFLIDAQGMVQAVDGAPAATLDTITRFARGQ